MSFTLDETSGNLGGLLPSGYHAEALGYVNQLERALRDNQWSGQNRIGWVVLSLANDANPRVMTTNAKLAINIARDAGIPVIVRRSPLGERSVLFTSMRMLWNCTATFGATLYGNLA